MGRQYGVKRRPQSVCSSEFASNRNCGFVKSEVSDVCVECKNSLTSPASFWYKNIEYDTNIDDVTCAVEKEMNGPGRFLGYRALHKKIREVHTLNVPRNVVYDVMVDVNPQGLQDRGGVGQPKRQRRKGAFTSTVSV